MMDDECGAIGMLGKGYRSTQGKLAPVPHCPLQIPQDLTRVAAVHFNFSFLWLQKGQISILK
jgi:hypothetical protein